MGTYFGQLKVDNGDVAPIGSTLYGTCENAASVVAKTATVTGFNKLITGVTVHIKFTNSNTASNPTLNVGGTGAKSIVKYGTTVPGTAAATSWQAGSVLSLTYDGTYWQMNDHLDDTNTQTVTGVKGNSESNYRTGNVNITATNIGLGNVGNFKAVSTVASQGLTDTEKSNARTNIGAGTSNLTIGTSSSTAMAGNTSVNKVLQTETTTNANYPILFSSSNRNVTTDTTDTARKSISFFYNANSKKINLGGDDTVAHTAMSSINFIVSDPENSKSMELTKSDLTISGDTWDATNTSLKTAVFNKLDKSGGTMTGSIITPRNDNMGIIPMQDNYGQIGSSSNHFYRGYINNIYGKFINALSNSSTVSINSNDIVNSDTWDGTENYLKSAIGKYITITSSVNLDDYKSTKGVYLITGASVTAGTTNLPVTTGGKLIVDTWKEIKNNTTYTYAIQKYEPWGSSSTDNLTNIYRRTYDAVAGTWSSWCKPAPGGTFWTKGWTATSTAAVNAKLTESIDISPGNYILIGSAPGSVSAEIPIAITTNANLNIFPLYANIRTRSHFIFHIQAAATVTNVYLKTAASASVTYSNIDQGGFRLIKLS